MGRDKDVFPRYGKFVVRQSTHEDGKFTSVFFGKATQELGSKTRESWGEKEKEKGHLQSVKKAVEDEGNVDSQDNDLAGALFDDHLPTNHLFHGMVPRFIIQC